jgi:DNA-3-methyladenine glycosylase
MQITNTGKIRSATLANPRISAEFFNRPTLRVARELLGTILVRRINRYKLSGRIVETEAYIGVDDPASHAFGKMTRRNKLMFGPPGHAYIYFIYGNHYCLNFVTESEGYPAAVLIRAFEPLTGIKRMAKNRGESLPGNLTNGPGKLCQALRIDKKLNGTSLDSDQLYLVESDQEKIEVGNSPRIGVSRGKNSKWRFFVKNNPYVSAFRGASR